MKLKLSSVAIAIIVIACLIIDMGFKNWKKQDRVIEWDVHSYYAYLPAIFIYKDIHLSKSDYHFDEHYWLFWPNNTQDGKKIIKTTMGMAILYAPFFFVGHAVAMLSDFPENGFSEPYKFLLLISALFYLFVGLDFLKKILIHFKFSDFHTAITILLLGLGTNLTAYSSQSAPMSHVYSFCLFSIFIYYTIKWFEFQTIKNTLIIGFLIGLISLVRPSNVIIMLFFAFYGITNLSDFKERILFFKKKVILLLLIVLMFVLVWIPQLLYWKVCSGSYFYYSYPDEQFFFNAPKIIDGLFSFRKGWLVYTPMMAFALAGVFVLKGALKKTRLPIILFFILNIYIIFSWWCWWYGGTYGQRCLIDSYALMAIPLASFVKYVSKKRWYYNALFYCISLFFVWLNIFQTYQFEYFSLHWDGMTKELYFKQFGKLEKIKDFDKYVVSPDYEEAKKGNDCDYRPSPIIKGLILNTYSGKKEKSKQTIQIMAFNNKYVCADGAANHIIIANRDVSSTWETFSLILFENKEYAIQAYDGHFLSSESNQQNEIIAKSETVNALATFTLINIDNDYIAFKASNGKFLSADEKSFQLLAKSTSIGEKEKFKLIVLSNN